MKLTIKPHLHQNLCQHELVNEGLQNKLAKMPEDAQMKLQETLQRIINEGSGGLICIIL